MYVLIENNSALIIDPNISQEAKDYLISEKVNSIFMMLTHEHYDHISGVNWLKQNFSNCTVVCSEKCHQNMQSPLRNGSKYFKALFIDKDSNKREEADKIIPIICMGDIVFKKEKNMIWEGHNIILTETPGHSEGSICICIDDRFLFTGDSLLKDSPVITKMPGGSNKDYEEITLKYLNSIDDNVLVYPGHGATGMLKDFQYVNCKSRNIISK